jgi:hypothetical protein
MKLAPAQTFGDEGSSASVVTNRSGELMDKATIVNPLEIPQRKIAMPEFARFRRRSHFS